MGLNDGFSYPPLTTDMQTRVIILAPDDDGAPIGCSHLVIDLDADWELYGGQRHLQPPPLDSEQKYNAEHRTADGTLIRRYIVPTLRLHPDKGRGLHPFQRYEALSYVWGSQSNPYSILLNGNHSM